MTIRYISRKLPHLLLGSLMLLSASAHALDKSTAMENAIALYENNIHIYMYMYDQTDTTHRDYAAEYVDQLKESMPAIIEAMQSENPDLAEEIGYQWESVDYAMDGILADGYQVQVAGEYETNLTPIVSAMFLDLRNKELSIEEEANLILHHILSNYVREAASHFGSFTSSFNQEGLDIASLAQEFDGLVDQLEQKYRQTENADSIRRLKIRWEFMRSYIEKSNELALPFIVSRYANEMFESLALLQPASEPAEAPVEDEAEVTAG